MVKSAAGSREGKKDQFAIRSGVAKEYSGERYSRQQDQRERWLAEHQHNEAVEKAIAAVSRFSYDPEDYVPFLVKEPFREPPRKEFQYLLPERILATEQKFRRPILKQWGMMAAVIVGVALFPHWISLVIGGTLLGGIGYLQYNTLQDRQRILARTEENTRQEIEELSRQQEAEIEELRKQHEQAEEERIDFYVRLMNADESVVILVLDEFLAELPLPFPLDLDVNLHRRVFQLKAWLPAKTIIPSERSSLAESGKIQYEKKDSLEINRQYAELCAAILMQAVSVVFSKLPMVDRVYASGIHKGSKHDECLISLQMDRSQMEKVQRASTALLAVQTVSGVYECDEFLKLMPVEPILPEGWGVLDPREIRGLRIQISRRAIPGLRNKILENN